jgi:V/A-type H+/Na+-transporting ATPase subunit C
MASNYGYLNARVRGMRTRLVGDAFVRDAIDAGSFDAFTTALAQTGYATDLEEARARYGGGLPMVDAAIASNVRRSARSLLDMAKGTAHALVGVLLLRYDVANLKAVARAFHARRGDTGEGAQVDLDEVRAATMPAGALTLATLERMVGANDLPNAAQILILKDHPLAKAFRRAVASYVADGDLLRLEVALDLAYYQVALATAEREGAPESFVRYLQLEIDATNLGTAIKLRDRGLDAERFFVDGGRVVSKATFLEIANAPAGTALPSLRPPFDAVGERADLAAVEATVREARDRFVRSQALEPLDIGLVVHYLHAKEREAAQLRLVARGAYYGVSSDTLKRELGHA